MVVEKPSQVGEDGKKKNIEAVPTKYGIKP